MSSHLAQQSYIIEIYNSTTFDRLVLINDSGIEIEFLVNADEGGWAEPVQRCGLWIDSGQTTAWYPELKRLSSLSSLD